MENMTVVRKNEIVQIPVSMIKPSPYQTRHFFDRKTVENLSKSIQQFGVLQPICVRHIGKYGYELVFGERRLKACKEIGMFYIPCIIVDIGERDCAVISAVENIHRKNTDFFEMAEAILNIIKEYGYTVSETARILGEKEDFIINKLKLVKIKYECRRIISENNLSEEFALVLAKINNADLMAIIVESILKFNLSLKKTKALVEFIVNRTYIGMKTDKADIDMMVSKFIKVNMEQKIKYYVNDIKFFTNSIYQIVQTMNESDIKTECAFNETDNMIEVNIKIEK